jgi:hypothetical protein
MRGLRLARGSAIAASRPANSAELGFSAFFQHHQRPFHLRFSPEEPPTE